MDDAEDIRAATPLQRLRAWLGPPRSYVLTRWLILRMLGVVYLFAFLGIVVQGLPLFGEHGLTPAVAYVDRLHQAGVTFWDVPSVFVLDASDAALRGWAVAGVVLAAALAVGYANLPSLAALWLIYGSYERIGQLWFGFGWEIQLLETTVIAACLVHPWDPRPLRAPAPPLPRSARAGQHLRGVRLGRDGSTIRRMSVAIGSRSTGRCTHRRDVEYQALSSPWTSTR